MSDLKKIDDAWLNLEEISTDNIFNPMNIIDFDDEDFHYKLIWLMSRPEYFSFLCKYIFNINILPSQALFLCEMWNRRFPMLIASRGFGKSFILSLYSMMRALLLPERKVVVVGAAFRQSKVLFEYMETIWSNAPVLRSMCDSSSGPRRDVDRCVMRINKSRVTCLPLGDGQKIRGQRANDIMADEFACCGPSTLIETKQGLKKIGDVVNNDESVLVVNKDGNFEKPAKHIRTPRTDVYRITSQNGYSFECSNIHKVLTSEGWKIAKDLTKEDYLIFDNKYKFPNSYIKDKDVVLDEKLAKLMGLLVSKGYIANKNYFSITTTDGEMVDWFVDEYSDLNPKVYTKEAHTDKRGWDCKRKYDIRINNTNFREILFNLGLDYKVAGDKEIPWSILQSPRPIVVSFLSGLFYGDGSVFLWKDRLNTKLGVSYYSVSKELVDQLQVVLWKLGYLSNKQSRKSKISPNKQWMLRLNGERAFDFAKELGVKKFDNVLDSDEYKVLTRKNTGVFYDNNRECFTASVYHNGESHYVGRFKTEEEAASASKDYKKNLPLCLKIKKVEKLDEKEVLYDFYLPETNSFYGNGFVQHNSIPREIFETVVAGFAAVSSDPIANVKRIAAKKKAKELGVEIIEEEDSPLENKNNQIILSGTAYYDFNHFAEYWKKWKSMIQSQGQASRLREIFGEEPPKDFNWKDYSIIRIPYELLPEGFMDASQVARSKATVHAGIYQMEFGATFTRDSQGFFKRSLIESCVVTDNYVERQPILDSEKNEICFQAQLAGNSNKKYVFGVDPASEVDNFSIVVLEIHNDHRRIVHCWTTNREQHKEKVKSGFSKESDFYAYCARKIRDLMKIFPCVAIAMDAQGGGIAVMESLHDSGNLEDGEVPIWPIIEEGKEKDTDNERGLHILEMCQFAKYDWLAEANHGLRKDLEDKSLLFPMFDGVSLGIANAQDGLKGRMFDTLEQCVMEIEDLKDELTMIQITQTNSGRDKWDTPETVIGTGKKGKLRKDRYSSLIMANMSARKIARTPSQEAYNFYGGFATVDNDKSKDKNLFSGPSWFTDQMKDVY